MADNTASLVVEVKTSGVTAANRELQQLQNTSGKTEQSVKSLTQRFSGLSSVIAGLSFAAVAKQTLSIADEMTSLDSRLKLVTKSTKELSVAQGELFRQSQNSQTSYKANADLYVSIARATDSLGVSQERLLGITDGVSKALAVSGSSAAAAKGALIQFSQALSSGTLRGDEFNSMNEGAPRLMQALAEGLGVARGELRAWAEEGRLTTDVILPALEKGLIKVNSEFGQLTPTIAMAATSLGNSFDKLVSDVNKSSGATSAIASGINALSNNLDAIATVIGVTAVAAFGKYTGAIASGIAATAQKIQADRAAAVSSANAAAATARLAAAEKQSALIAQTAARDRLIAVEQQIAADKAITASAALAAEQQVASRQAQFTAVASIIRQEIALEKLRFDAQINDIGRAKRVNDMAQLSMQLANAEKAAAAQSIVLSKQKAASETAAAAAATAASAKIVAAREAEILATEAAAASTLKARAATVAADTAVAALSRTAAFARGALAMLGGPIGLITTLLSAGAIAWMVWKDRTVEATDDAAKAAITNLDNMIAKLGEMNGKIESTNRASYNATIQSAQSEAKTVAAEINRLNTQLDALDAKGGRGRFSEEGKNAQESLNKLYGREIELNKQLAESRSKASEVGVSSINKFLSANAVGAEKIRISQEKILNEFADAIKQTGGEFDPNNKKHAEALKGLNAALEDAKGKKPSSGNSGLRSASKESDEAKAYEQAIKGLASINANAQKSTLELSAAQSTLYDLMTSPAWATMPEAWKQTALAQFESARAAEQAAEKFRDHAKAMDEGKRIMESMRTPEEELAAQIVKLNGLLDEGAISWDVYARAVFAAQDKLDGLPKKAEETGKELDEFTKQAARNMQDAMADFFINPTKDGMDSLVESFGKTLQNMIAQAASAQLMNILFGDMGKTGKVSGLAGSALDWLSQAVFSANGNAFSGGETVKKFANGGAFGNGRILTKPTMFAMGGTFGVAGEAGPEGALPLKRMSNGKLGVHMSGGGGMTINQTINAGAGTDKAEVRRAAASGARSVLGVANGARRYG